MTACAVVWFKRDLRWRDHAPLAAALRFERALALYVIEPAWLQSAECDVRHVTFALACVAELRTALAARGLPLLVRVGAVPQVLQELQRELGFSHLFSHEETGTGWSYSRDIAVAAWCKAQRVAWQEFAQTGVVRRLRSRSGWAGLWAQRMNAPVSEWGGGFKAAPGFDWADVPALPSLRDLGFVSPQTAQPPAGEDAAWATLNSFLSGRGRDYRRAMSSPLTAADSCSRLSAYLAFGCISLRCVHQATEGALRSTTDRHFSQALRSFSGRLRWHCHFMQKLEDEPAIEFRNFARAHDGLRRGDGANAATEHGVTANEAAVDAERFAAWCEGRTGFPMVDACMRQLRATGWLNFRMRAMLVSFAAYHLWLHWRAPGLFLARQFLDFEPGIHWSQMQMQSGTTGINTLRIYSPSKQARDQDPGGVYQRLWLPEWGTPAYPKPIVDDKLALQEAKDKLYGLRKTSSARTEAQAILQKHGSRKSGLPQTTSRPAKQGKAAKAETASNPDQGELF
jgi:deoxyribodipyrimidine photo-lyase